VVLSSAPPVWRPLDGTPPTTVGPGYGRCWCQSDSDGIGVRSVVVILLLRDNNDDDEDDYDDVIVVSSSGGGAGGFRGRRTGRSGSVGATGGW
jgi:hypothetical protein